MRAAFQTFTDPGEFAAVLDPSNVELIPLARGRFTAEFAAVEFPRMRLRRMTESLPRLAHVQHPPDLTDFGFLSDERLAPVVVDGMSVTADVVLRFGSTLPSYQRSFGPTQWSNISVDRAGLNALSPDIAEPDLATSGELRVVVPGKNAMRRLRRLHAEAIALAIQPPPAFVEPEAVRSMENQLIEAMADCLNGPDQMRPTSVQARRTAVMERFRDLLEESLDRALYLPEVCAALGVSHRTLSYCCQEFLGVAPKRYFYMRRMHLVRHALRQADWHATTVTEIATRHGFWEFGRFSVQYRALFGETPSATLRRSCGHMEH